MATKVSCRSLPTERKYEPAFAFEHGITDETTDTKYGAVSRTHYPPKSESRPHYHENGDLFFYCISGRTIFRIGREKQEYVIEAGDFIYIPRGEIHSNFNPSETEPVEGIAGCFGASHPEKSGKVLVDLD